MNIPRVGFGYDVHIFAKDRELWIGGIKIEYSVGLLGHSDADVLIHALCDAILGAANLRDIGFHFPDTSKDFKNIDSKILLSKTMQLLRSKGYEFGNMDCTICAEEPKFNPHIPAMQTCLSEVMEVQQDTLSIKATTSEKMGFVGRKEGIAVYATVLIYKK
jgi:2-C-methyl-D-erythritol 2,4-cyclodiphosphate synthase